VPVQLDVVQKALPQFINNTITIVVALKRRLRYKNVYQTGKVRVHVVMKALKELCSRALYKAENICINGNWNNVLTEEHGNFADTLENPTDFDTSDESRMKHLLKHWCMDSLIHSAFMTCKTKLSKLHLARGNVHLEYSRTNSLRK
jgi:hypothetical protein